MKKSKGLVVYYELKNKACKEISRRLKDKKFKIPLGVSIARISSFHIVATEAGIKDYAKAFGNFRDIGDYFAIDISCPKVFGG